MSEKATDLQDGWILIDEEGNVYDVAAASDEAGEVMPRREHSEQFQPKDEAEETEAWIEGLLRNKKKKKRKAKKPEDVDNPDAQPQEASNHSTEARTDDSITTEEEDIWEDPRVPPLKWAHERNKRTIIANLIEICVCMKRNEEHVTKFLFSQLGTSGRFDGKAQFVMRGRFQPDRITKTLRRYMAEYVICQTCGSASTRIERGEGRKETVECNTCGSFRPTAIMKAGCIRPVGVRLENRD